MAENTQPTNAEQPETEAHNSIWSITTSSRNT